jgi:glycosyltransferase involved in cell wall biosynthesis
VSASKLKRSANEGPMATQVGLHRSLSAGNKREGSFGRQQPIRVMHVIDTLAAAGAERVAVNIVNHLPRHRFVTYLCTTRSDGPLDLLVAEDILRLRLERRSRFDFDAIMRLRKFIQDNEIHILHAHSSALFITRLAALGTDASILWHAHYGRYALEDQRAYRYRLATSGIGGVITVNKDIAEWCSRKLRVPSSSVWYLPNPVSLDQRKDSPPVSLPGSRGSRIICLANFRPEKDHLTLVRAMSRVVAKVPGAQLLLAGKTNDQVYKETVEKEIAALGLERNVSILGERHDVAEVLRASDIGVLSSSSEGLPMSLLEYGVAGLPAIATEVGQCPDVLDHGRAGILVPPAGIGDLADGLILLLQSVERRRMLGECFRERVNKTFSPEAVMGRIGDIYEIVTQRSGKKRQS